MGDAVDARGENAAGLAEGFEFKAGCWGKEELDPCAFLADIAGWLHIEKNSIEGKMIVYQNNLDLVH